MLNCTNYPSALNDFLGTCIGREFEQQDAAGPQGDEAQTKCQSVGTRAGAQPGAGAAAGHGCGWDRLGPRSSHIQTHANTMKAQTHLRKNPHSVEGFNFFHDPLQQSAKQTRFGNGA